MLRDVRYFGVAGRMAKKGEMKVRVCFCLVAAVLLAIPARAGGLALSPQAQQALDHIYGGDPDAGIAAARDIERAQPLSPVGLRLEGEAAWWLF